MKEVNIAIIFSIFKITMSFNVFVAMEAPFHMKLFEIWLWRTLEASCISRHPFIEIFKLTNITRVQVLGLVEDEQTFSTLSFRISKLKNVLNGHTYTLLLFPKFLFFECLSM
jgi:hypothetical protein